MSSPSSPARPQRSRDRPVSTSSKQESVGVLEDLMLDDEDAELWDQLNDSKPDTAASGSLTTSKSPLAVVGGSDSIDRGEAALPAATTSLNKVDTASSQPKDEDADLWDQLNQPPAVGPDNTDPNTSSTEDEKSGPNAPDQTKGLAAPAPANAKVEDDRAMFTDSAPSPNPKSPLESTKPVIPTSRAILIDTVPLGEADKHGNDRQAAFLGSLGEDVVKQAKEKERQRVGMGVPLVLGVAVVDFNHLIGPTIEYAYPPSLQTAIDDDEDLSRLLPFLALPDGAHLSEEDYSYFHCVYHPSIGTSSSSNVPANTTLFGISCNRQLAASELIRRPSDVTRSTVQKAVVVIASQPVFGPIRDKLGVVTRAYFAQRDFTETEILRDFYESLEDGLEAHFDESVMSMGTSLRELIHKFRHRTLVLLKMLILQKRIMLYGYPVEMLCTYQYSLLSLVPGLLLELQDAASPDLDLRRRKARPTSFKSSDRKSLLRYMGMPLHLFGKDAFFQPYLPLQQVDMLYARSWLVGTTNQIVTQQKDCKYDLLVNIDSMTFEFTDPKVERMVGLTAADRKWMDEIVRTVEETWNVPEGQKTSFKGSDDDLRVRFEEYICAALASIKLATFIRNTQTADIVVAGIGVEGNVMQNFSEGWLREFKTTPAYDIWEKCTDPLLFDICEPKHPCEGPVNVVQDLGLRFTEGIHDLKLDQQLAPAREAVTSAFAVGSSTLFKAFDGVRNEVSTRLKEREDAEKSKRSSSSTNGDLTPTSTVLGSPASTASAPRSAIQAPQMVDVKATLGNIGNGIGTLGTGIGSFFGSRVASFRGPPQPAPSTGSTTNGLRPMSLPSKHSDPSLKSRQ